MVLGHRCFQQTVIRSYSPHEEGIKNLNEEIRASHKDLLKRIEGLERKIDASEQKKWWKNESVDSGLFLICYVSIFSIFIIQSCYENNLSRDTNRLLSSILSELGSSNKPEAPRSWFGGLFSSSHSVKSAVPHSDVSRPTNN